MEDEKQMCDTVARSLYAAGYEVDTCYDGAEALECILAENYDLIVLDLNLPGMDGMDLLKELRKENEETKVLILSARGQIADKVEAVPSAGAGSADPQSDKKKICAEGCLSGKWRDQIRYHQTRGLCQRNPGFPDKKRKRNFGISASPPWQTGKPGRIDRACLGCLRGQLQRIHPRTYVFASAKAQGGTWIRSDFK